MPKYFSFFVFFIMVCTSVLAQNGSINGRLLDQQKRPLSFGNIVLDPSGQGTSTDDQGHYNLTNLPSGKHTIKATFVGYKPIEKEIMLTSNQFLELDLVLESEIALDEVVISGTLKPTRLTASPIRVEVLSSEELNIFAPAAAASVMDGIKMINGVQEVTACGVCFTNSISINGLSGAYTAVLMDGAPIYGNLAAVYGLNGIPGMIIDRIEVIKGPSSTLYGSEAVAGVINIITKDPKQQPVFSVDIMGTTHRESFGNVSATAQLGDTYGFIGLNYAYINAYDDDNNDGFGDGVNMDRLSLFSKWAIARKSGKPFNIAGKLFYEDRRNGVEAFMKDRAYRELRGSSTIYGESILTKRAEIFGSYTFNTTANIKLDFSFSDHDQDSYYGSDAYTAKQTIAFTNLLWNITKSRHDILLGATGRYQIYNDNTVATSVLNQDGSISDAPDNQFIPGVFAQDEWQVSQNWSLLTGLRLDHYQKHGLIVSPRLSTKGELGQWTTLRANFGTGFRIVNLFTEDHAFVTGQRTVEILGSLNPERSVNGTIDLNHVYSGLGVGTIGIEAYYTYFFNKIIPNYDDPGKIVYENTSGNAQTRGIGITVNHSFAVPFSLNVGFNVQKATETDRNDAGNWYTKPIEFAPQWSSIITANYVFKEADITLAYTANFTGKMSLPEVYDLDETGQPLDNPRSVISQPYSIHTLQATKRFNKALTIYTGVENLLNYRQQSSPLSGFNDPNYASGFSPFFDTSYAYAPNHGIEFYLGIKWSLNQKNPDTMR